MSIFGSSEPTVLLSFHDAMVASMRADMAAERARYDALLDKFTALRMVGAVAAPGNAEWTMTSVPSPVAAPPHDKMLALIDAKAGNNTRIRGMMLRQLAADRAANVSDEDIRAGIMNGVPGNGVPA